MTVNGVKVGGINFSKDLLVSVIWVPLVIVIFLFLGDVAQAEREQKELEGFARQRLIQEILAPVDGVYPELDRKALQAELVKRGEKVTWGQLGLDLFDLCQDRTLAARTVRCNGSEASWLASRALRCNTLYRLRTR